MVDELGSGLKHFLEYKLLLIRFYLWSGKELPSLEMVRTHIVFFPIGLKQPHVLMFSIDN